LNDAGDEIAQQRQGRVTIALRINEAIASGSITAPVVLSRDHHDVSGTDSPFRETSNVYDGSSFCADMATQNFVGDAIRGFLSLFDLSLLNSLSLELSLS